MKFNPKPSLPLVEASNTNCANPTHKALKFLPNLPNLEILTLKPPWHWGKPLAFPIRGSYANTLSSTLYGLFWSLATAPGSVLPTCAA